MTRWSEVLRFRWKRTEPPNIIEARTVVIGVRHIGRSRSNWNQRHVFSVDNLATLGCLSKGRSGRPPLSLICRAAAAFILAYGIRLLLRWVESHRNHADGPSRQKKLGYYAGGEEQEEAYKVVVR